MSTHARHSPSSAKRWMTCPGSQTLIDKLLAEGIIQPDTGNFFTAEGTVAHQIGEDVLNEKEHDPYGLIGDTVKESGFDIEITDEMIDAVHEYIDFIYEEISNAEVFADLTVQMLVEAKCSLKKLKVPGMDGGTTDCLLYNEEHQFIHVIDYKHGQGVAVEVEDNPQLLSYALGALIKLGIREGDWSVTITVVQPRAYHPDGGIRSQQYKSDDIWGWAKNELIPAGKLANDPDAPLVPSDEGCRFCPARGNCSAIYDKTQELAVAEFESETLPDPNTLTTDQKIQIVNHIDMIKSFILAVENQVKLEVDHGSTDYDEVFKLVRKQTRRKFTDDAIDPLFSELLDHLDEEDVFIKKIETITNITARLKKKYGKERADEIMNDVTTKPDGDVVLAKLTDKRKAVQPSVISDFENLD